MDPLESTRQARLDAAWRRIERDTQEAEPPPGAVFPILTEDGGCECPECGWLSFTPRRPTSSRQGGRSEKTILLADRHLECSNEACRAIHWISRDLAVAHNAYWFPDS